MESYQDYLGGVFAPEKITKYWKNQMPPTNIEEKFKDPFFLPNQNSICAKDEFGNYIDKEFGAKKAAEIDLTDIEWLCAEDIFSKFLIFDDKIEVDDIKQGNIGNCYFLSAIAALCEFPELIFQIFRTKEISPIGYYEIVMFIDGHWQIVILDDHFPVQQGTTNLKYAKPNGNELWVVLLEKAWAKVNGGYANIVSGWPCDPLSALTGFASSKLIHSTFSTTSETLWNTLIQAEKNDNLMCTSTKNDTSIITSGLIANHAYTLIGAKEFNDIKLVHIRNPWGYKEWNGRFSDSSSDWTEELKEFFGYSDKDDGTFFMAFDDFKNYFVRTDVCYITYDSNVKVFETKIDNNYKDAPLVYNLYIDEDSKVAISAIRKYWRYNRELRDVNYPMSLILCRYDDEKLEYVDGEYNSLESVEVIKDLKKGFYAIWLYCPLKWCQNPKPESLTLRFISNTSFKADLAALDVEFGFIKEVIKAGVRAKYSDKVEGKGAFNCIENCFKRSGLGIRYSINKSSTSYQKWTNHAQDVQNMFLLPPYENLKDFDFYVAPKSDNIILGMRNEQLNPYWFNLKSDVKTINKAQYEQETANNNLLKNNKFNLDIFTSKNIKLLDVENKYYDYISKSLHSSKTNLKFNKLNLKDIFYDDLVKKYPFEMEILQKLPHDDLNEQDLTWAKIKYENGIYIGQIDLQKKRHGRGAYIWNNKNSYIGFWIQGTKENFGHFYMPNQKLSYSGQILNGLRHGIGELYYENDDVYKGEFVNDVREGKGTYLWADNSKWIGTFSKDNLDGVGIYYPEDGSEEYEVIYREGEQVE